MNNYFYKNWGLFYILLFFLIGWLIYSLLWNPYMVINSHQINQLKQELQECRENTNEEVDQVISCNEEVKSGGQGRTETRHELGSASGRVIIDYDMQGIPDQMDVYYNGKLVTSTNDLVSYTGSLGFDYNATKNTLTYCTVVMSAPEENTAWSYVVRCPQ